MDWNRLQPVSLKTRVTLLTLVIFLLTLWALVLYAGQLLRKDLERVIGEQQLSVVRIIAVTWLTSSYRSTICQRTPAGFPCFRPVTSTWSAIRSFAPGFTSTGALAAMNSARGRTLTPSTSIGSFEIRPSSRIGFTIATWPG